MLGQAVVIVLEGLASGGLYVVIAIGFSLVAGVMRLLNLAHGEFLVGAAYVLIALAGSLSLNPFLATLVTVPLMFAFGYVVQRGLLQPLMSHGEEPVLVATFGLSIGAQALFQILWGSAPAAVISPIGLTGVEIFGHTMRWVSILAFVMALVLAGGLYLLLTRTTFGLSLRAAAQDPMAALGIGVNVPQVFALCFGLGAAMTSCGALILASGFSVEPEAGASWLMRAVTVMVIGGMGSIWGTLGAGLLIGVAEEAGVATLGPEYRDLVIFTLLLALLLARPNGLVAGRAS